VQTGGAAAGCVTDSVAVDDAGIPGPDGCVFGTWLLEAGSPLPACEE
jgi:hypothetical protein